MVIHIRRPFLRGRSSVYLQMLHDFLTSRKFIARTKTKVPHEWATKAVPTKAKAQMMPPVTREKNRKLVRSVVMRSYDGLLREHSAVEDGSSQLLLEVNSDRPPTYVASETTSGSTRFYTPTMGSGSFQGASRIAKTDTKTFMNPCGCW